ncbi:hypothetical protein V2W45_1361650, partial [Cenococcum geophilum]
MPILLTNNATATFFIIKSQLGNHAMHNKPSRPLRLLNKTYAAVNIEPPSKYFRLGSGLFSERMRQMLGRLDYRIVLGSIYPHNPQIPYW